MVNFVEELLQQGYLVEEQEGWRLTGDIRQVQAPDTLRQLIEKQIGQLREEEQHILEVASVAGSDFVVSAVAASLQQDADTVEEVCEELARRGHFLEERGITEWPDGTMSGHYSFSHALYQNVLYDRIAQARRIRAHRQIGRRLEEGYGERTKEMATELALHFEQGRDYQRAVQYLQHAGENASRKSAHREAVAHLTKGLELLNTLPDTPERSQQELSLRRTLGIPLAVTKGWAAPDVRALYDRMQILCQRTGDTPQLFPPLCGLTGFYFIRAQHQRAQASAQELLRLAHSLQDPALLLVAHTVLGFTLVQRGELTEARMHLELVSSQYDPQQHHGLTALYTGQDLGVICRSYGALILGQLGYLDQACQKSEEAIELAQQLKHPFSEAAARGHSVGVYGLRRDVRKIKEQVDAVLALSTEHGFPHFLAVGTLHHGYVLVFEGRPDEGIAQMQQGLTTFQVTGARRGVPEYLGNLARAYAAGERVDEGLRVAAEALTLVEQTEERIYEAELHRLKGELTLQKLSVVSSQSSVPSSQPLTPSTQAEVEREAEECFLKAIDIARKQQAMSLELRATTSLARLWQQQALEQGAASTEPRAKRQGQRAGSAEHASRNTPHATRNKLAEAHRMLSEVYNWFTEGFDTKDLQEAKALIEELSD